MRRVLLLLAMLTGLVCAQSQAAQVTPADGLTVINPTTGESVSGRGNSGGKGWMQKNPAWDGKTIKVAGAKGEFVLFQLCIVREPSEVIKNITITPSIKGVKQVATYRSWCIWDSPEIAVPFEGNQYKFSIPSEVPLETDATYAAWSTFVEFQISRAAAAGKLTGTVKVSADSGLSEVSFPIEIEVYNFELPKTPRHIIEMNTYGGYVKALPKTPETVIKLSKFMRDHRCTFVQVPYHHDGYLDAKWWAPKVNTDTGAIDWTEWDKIFGPLFDGSAFEDGGPVSHFMLPLNYNWPIGFGEFNKDRAKYDRINIEVRKNIAKHIKEKVWNQTIFQEFHNENPDNGAKLPWFLDEPRNNDDMEGHTIYSSYHAEAMKDMGKDVRFHYRIDISYWQRVKDGMNKNAANINDWTASWYPDYMTNEAAKMFRKFADDNNGIFLRYGEIDGFNGGGKINNWSMFDKYLRDCWTSRADGFEQWIIDCWAEKNGNGPMQYSQAAGMRDLIWPGKHFGIQDALASMRLKALRESNNLFDYAELAVKSGKTTRENVDSMVGSMNIDKSDAHFELKAKLAAMLSE